MPLMQRLILETLIKNKDPLCKKHYQMTSHTPKKIIVPQSDYNGIIWGSRGLLVRELDL